MRVHAVSGPEVASLSVTAAYDTIAAGYDEQVRGDDWMRRRLHAQYARAFRPGQRVLDVGCGTGTDAIALARMGIRVVGIDGSAAMVTRLREKVQAAQVEPLVEAQVLEIQRLGQLRRGPFDGIVSAFASLSAVPDLAGFAEDSARLVRPGGRMVLHLLNRFSLWEFLGYVARRDVTSAAQVGRLRTRCFSIGGESVRHTLYFSGEAYQRFLAGPWMLRESYSLGAVRPPHTVRRLPPWLVGGLEWLDLRVGGCPLLRDAGRFFVLDVERLA